MVGLVVEFMRVWVPFAFLPAGMGFGGALGIVLGPVIFRFVETEDTQTALAFFLVFFLMLLLGGVVTYATRGPLTLASALTFVSPLGALLNRVRGLLAGALFSCILLSVILIALQQIPVVVVAKGIQYSSFASGPIGVVDRYVASIEVSEDREEFEPD